MNKILKKISLEITDSFKRLVAKDESGYRQLWVGCALATGMRDDKFDPFRPEFWTPRVTRFMRQKLYAAKFFKDYSADVVDGDVVHIPHFSDSTGTVASDISVTNGEVTAIDIVETKTDLTVDNWKGGAVFISKFEQREIMKRPAVIDEYSSWLGYRCARNAERAILANITSLTTTCGFTNTDLYSTTIERAFGILESNSVPREDCRYFISPKVYWNQLMTIQKYYDASMYGKPTVPYGAHDVLYGLPVVLTTNVPAYDSTSGVSNAIIHKDAIAFAMMGPDFVAKDSEHLRRKLIADVMYGDQILQPSWGINLVSTGS